MPTRFFQRTMITKCDQLSPNDVKLISNQRHDFRGFGIDLKRCQRKVKNEKKTYLTATSCFLNKSINVVNFSVNNSPTPCG